MRVAIAEMTSFITERSPQIQAIELNGFRNIIARDGWFQIECEIEIDSADDELFMETFGDVINKTIYATPMTALAEPAGFHARLKGIFSVTPPADASTEYTYTLTDDRYIDGALWECYSFTPGDYISLEIHHPIVGLLEKYVDTWYCTSGSQQFRLYKGSLPAGLIIKLIYTNTHASNAAQFMINFFMHEKVE